MAHKVENKETLSQGSRGYLFFSKPPELWQANFHDETHKEILNESRRKKSEILVAGGLSVDYDDRIQVVVDGSGSGSLVIPKSNSQIVAEFIKTLPGIEADRVLCSEQHR